MNEFIWKHFIKWDCPFLESDEFSCRLAEEIVPMKFPYQECPDCLVATYHMRCIICDV
jgi:hypothetical protein